MPIKIDGGLSAVNRLREEGIVTIGKDRAMTQDIRPLKILILNLMPLKSRRNCSSCAYWATPLSKSRLISAALCPASVRTRIIPI